MNYSLAQVVLVISTSGGEDEAWTQMLVLVILATLVGIGSLIKTRANKLKNQQEDYPEYGGGRHARARRQNKALKELKGRRFGVSLKTAQSGAVIEESVSDFKSGDIFGRGKAKDEPARKGERDLASGMEMLEQDFLVRTVENTEGEDDNDVTMRKLGFNELLRRKQLKAADSDALRTYVINEGNLYGKDIQCEAMKELAERTRLRSG